MYGLDEVRNIVEDGGQQLVKQFLHSSMVIFHDTRLLLFFVASYFCTGNLERAVPSLIISVR